MTLRMPRHHMVRAAIIVLTVALTFLLGVGIWNTTHQPTSVVDVTTYQLPTL